MNDEYISKHKAYTTMKDLEAAYVYPPLREAFATAARHIDQMKAAEVQPVKCSRWIPKNDGTYKVYCESCGHEQNPKAWDSDYKYCPNCGAEMKGESICY